VLGEDDEFALQAIGATHLGRVLQELAQLFPLAILPRVNQSLGLLFEVPQREDFGFELGDGLSGGRLVNDFFFELSIIEISKERWSRISSESFKSKRKFE
jgi:hypothetical protein